MADARDVGGHFLLVGQAYAGDLAQRRVRLLRRHRAHLETDATLLRGAWDRLHLLAEAVPVLAHRRRLHLLERRLAALAHELVDRRHEVRLPCLGGCWIRRPSPRAVARGDRSLYYIWWTRR